MDREDDIEKRNLQNTEPGNPTWNEANHARTLAVLEGRAILTPSPPQYFVRPSEEYGEHVELDRAHHPDTRLSSPGPLRKFDKEAMKKVDRQYWSFRHDQLPVVGAHKYHNSAIPCRGVGDKSPIERPAGPGPLSPRNWQRYSTLFGDNKHS